VDDDIDGLVDEGFADDDGDGVVDCLEVDCRTLDVALAGEFPQDDACVGAPAPVEDPWSYVVEWGFSTSDPDRRSVSPPAVGNLTDDNGDGVVDRLDTPDIAVLGAGNIVSVFDGATGALHFEVLGALGWTSMVVSDSDADGAPDLLVYDWRGYIVRYDGTGRRLAVSDTPADDTWNLSVADLDADGMPEVIAADGIYAGDTLERRAGWEENYTGQFVCSAVGDVDRDGDQEIFRDGVLYDSDGSVVWEVTQPVLAFSHPLLVQADTDDDAELVLVSDRLLVFDTDGTLLAEGPDFAGWGAGAGPPCAADFDEDGETEVVYPVYYEGPFVMMELDGTTAWSTPTPWRTTGAGCSAADLDGDGTPEVIYGADEALYVYDGRTGATLFEYADHLSPTAMEFPVVADVDLDGHAEIVVVNPTGPNDHLAVLGHAGDGWAPVGPTWPQNDYAGVQIDDDGHVPAAPDAAWLTSGTWRAVDNGIRTVDLPDLVAAITDVCVADCTLGSVEVAVRVANEGLGDSTVDTRLVLHAIEPEGLRDVAEATVGPIPAGRQLDGWTFSLSPDDLGALGFAVTIDADGGVEECDEADNTDRWEDSYCP
jgi:hypothetical protein